MAQDRGPVVATYSIVAADPAAGDVGVAVASKFLAAGAVVPWASAGAGAVATQSYADASCGPRGLALMREGHSAAETLARLLADTGTGPDRQQLGLVDTRGGAAAHTGEGCHPWAGHIVGDGFACQGNILSGPQVVEAAAAAFRQSTGTLAERLLMAIKAGEAAGGDRRGRQSAAIYVARAGGGYLGANDVLVDLRVDDAVDPIAELQRLYGLHQLYFGASVPKDRIPIAAEVLAELKQIMVRAGHYEGPLNGEWDEGTEKALDALVGYENLEERFDLRYRTVDQPALDYLRQQFPKPGRS